MHQLVYYSIFAIVLYFILSSVFETFSAEQENFDPSLVPVSSIVTLAKVAQKLVNGNGTLTNPGNLQIGASASAPGNLTVTGNSTVGGNSNIGGTVSINNGTINLTSNGTGGLHFLKSGSISNNPIYNSLFSGPLDVKGDATFPQDKRIVFGDTNNTIGGNPGDGVKIRSWAGGTLDTVSNGKTIMSWDNNNVNINGGLRVTGKISTNGNLNGRALAAQIDNIRLGDNVISNNDANSNLLVGSANNKVQIWSSNLDVDRNLGVGGNSTVTGNSNIGGTVSINNGTINLTSNGSGGLYFLKSGTISNNPIYNSLFSGPLTINGETNTSGNLTLPDNKRLIFSDGNNTIGFNPGDGVKIRSWNGGTLDTVSNGKTIMSWDNSNVNINVNLNPNKFYLIWAYWGSYNGAIDNIGHTMASLQNAMNTANKNGTRSFVWRGEGVNDPMVGTQKNTHVVYKCGIDGQAKVFSSGNYDPFRGVTLSCP